ncbi:AAA family ATPase [Cellulophaga baltica]|uniref:AAA family ATPase n=1 Tax=Cellulophaga baltica TaxID=76594 RepID=UPI0037CBBE67
MKILELWISKYNNLEDITFDFNKSPLITLLVGQNGLGKSNFLEAVVFIFKHLHLTENERELTTDLHPRFFSYSIEYICKGNHIKIEAKNSSLSIQVKKVDEDELLDLSFSQFKKERENEYLPDFLIAYYSGENKRIKTLFSKHKINRETKLKRNIDSHPLGRFFFTDENFGELIFLMLWIFKDLEPYNKLINQVFNEFLQIETTSKIEISLINPDFYDKNKSLGVEYLNSSGGDYSESIWNLNGKVDSFVKLLLNNHIEHSEAIAYEEDNNERIDFIHLNFEVLAKTIIEQYKTPIAFFDVLEAANSIGIIDEIKSTINKQGARIRHNYSQLSEGEQQLLTILGLLLFTGEYDTLFLFDEPDTHLNPKWQRDFPELLDNFNIENKNSQILVATHSPLIVQSSDKADTFLFNKNEDKIVVDQNPHHIKNWRIDQVLQSEYFKIKNVRPTSLDDFMLKREAILNKEIVSPADIEQLKELDKDHEVLPTGETISDFETLHLLKQIISKASIDDKD